MPRLLRPHIPLDVRCRVVLRQIGLMPEIIEREFDRVRDGDATFGAILIEALSTLGSLLGVDGPKSLHLDHDPPLGAREKVFMRGKHVGYKPDANDPEFLIYRTDVEHRLKTNVRGEHGQHPDRVLIKKNRRIARREEERRGLRKPKPRTKMRSRSNWPPKGSRKINWRKT